MSILFDLVEASGGGVYFTNEQYIFTEAFAALVMNHLRNQGIS